MASSGDHQGPWVRHIPALPLPGHGAHTSASTTKSRDLGKSSQGIKETQRKAIGRGLERAQKGRGQHSRAGSGRKSVSSSSPPAPSLQHMDSRGRQHVRTCHQHPPNGILPTLHLLSSSAKPSSFSNSLSPTANCPFSAWQSPIPPPQLSPGCLAQGTPEKHGPPSQRRGTGSQSM